MLSFRESATREYVCIYTNPRSLYIISVLSHTDVTQTRFTDFRNGEIDRWERTRFLSGSREKRISIILYIMCIWILDNTTARWIKRFLLYILLSTHYTYIPTVLILSPLFHFNMHSTHSFYFFWKHIMLKRTYLHEHPSPCTLRNSF